MFYPLYYDSVNLNLSVYFITYRYADLVMNSINDICFYEANMVYDLCVIFVFTYKQCRLNDILFISHDNENNYIFFALLSTGML